MMIGAAHSIHTLHKKWSARLMLATIILALSSGLIIAFLTALLWQFPWYVFISIVFVAAAIVFCVVRRKIQAKDVSHYLNKTYPELEESTGLLLQNNNELNLLQHLQVQKIASSFPTNISQPPLIIRRMRIAWLLLTVSIAAGAGIYFFPSRIPVSKTAVPASLKTEIKLPQISKAILIIAPPAYTGKKVRQQQQFAVVAEEGSTLAWELTTNSAVKEMQLVFNDRSITTLRPSQNNTQWKAQKKIEHPGFYQVQIDGALSELYQIETLRDLPPAINVQSPTPNTLIEPWMSMQSQVQVSVTDDYGIANAFIAATISSGAGEAVKFKQTTIPFPGFSSGASRYQLGKLINLRTLGMNKGDELYFYVSATDSKGQEKKSDMYIVRIEDTAKLMSIEGLTGGPGLAAEFFRSQRQIIMETEQLLRNKDTINVALFNKRSNELGIDQKLLRMRYGKFLGEENSVEAGETGGHEDEHEHGSEEHEHEGDQSKNLLDAVTHNHDNAEDATFFDPETKKQLQATLTEMWKSELRLRTIKPKDALPFEYAALRLLKELQQSSRVYVAKTGVKMPPLKPEKRLTGELDKITAFASQQTIEPGDQGNTILRKALGILEQLRNTETISSQSQSILEQAGIQFSTKAAKEPSQYLTAFVAYRRILGKQYKNNDLMMAGSALQKMIAAAQQQPFGTHSNADMGLSKHYFNHLNRAND